MKTKRCSKCKEIRPIGEFNKHKTTKDKMNCWCKKCHNLKIKEWQKDNPEYLINWRKNNPEYYKEWYKNNSKKKYEYNKNWKKNNPEKIKLTKKRRLSIPKNKLSDNISTLIWLSLKGNKKGNHWEKIVGYNLQELMTRLEKLFQSGMNWKNYGDWHIDHIKPISSFNFNSYENEEFKECWALENLQPLWAFENQSKGKK